MIKNLHFVVELGREIKKALISGNNRVFANLMHEHWLDKRKFGPCRARRGNGCQFLASEKKCPAWRVDGPRSGYDWLSFA
jgi:hypothetical protein